MEKKTPSEPAQWAADRADEIASNHFFRTEIPGRAIPALRGEIAASLIRAFEEGRRKGIEEVLQKLRSCTMCEDHPQTPPRSSRSSRRWKRSKVS